MSMPDLSIIIPTLNEAEDLPLLLSDLAVQRDVHIEVVIVDAGSEDDTVNRAKAFFAVQPFRGQIVITERGRGLQLNRGATVAKADWLLFLHADSRLPLGTELSRSLGAMKQRAAETPDEVCAGHLALRFDLPRQDLTFGFYFYETKAHLNRSGCVHGDQGFLLRKQDFQRVGPFAEDLPVMEDTLFADRLQVLGHWLLLPAEITTSARRFQVEGLVERQTLNALLMNFMAIGWREFIVAAPQVYQAQPNDRLQLQPFLQLISDLLSKKNVSQRWALWLATGRYVCSQVWQLGLYLDCRQAFAEGQPPGTAPFRWLTFFDRFVVPLTNHPPGRFITALLVRAWFAWISRRN